MVTIEAYLIRLKKLQTDFPTQALANPLRGDAFEYGQKCGVVMGLNMAEKLIEQMLNDEDIHERELEARFGR